jgi:hypothetical protein
MCGFLLDLPQNGAHPQATKVMVPGTRFSGTLAVS